MLEDLEKLGRRGRAALPIVVRTLADCLIFLKSGIGSPCLDSTEDLIAGAALNVIRSCATGEDQEAIAVILRCVEYGSDLFREHAVRVLKSVVRHNDPRVIQALTSKFTHEDYAVRRVALDALSQVTTRGNSHVLVAVVANLWDTTEEHVNTVSLQALGKCATQGDQDVMLHIKSVFDHVRVLSEQPRVLQIALEALAEVCQRGDTHNAKLASRFLQHPHVWVRTAAARSVARMVKKDDDAILRDLYASLTTFNSYHQFGKLREDLMQIPEVNDSVLIAELSVFLNDTSSSFSHDLASLFFEIVGAVDPRVVNVAIACLPRKDYNIQRVAIQYLAKAAQTTDVRVQTAVIQLLSSTEYMQIRSSALEVLVKVSHLGCEKAVHAACECLFSGYCLKEAPSAIGRIAKKGDENIVRSLTQRLRDVHDEVKASALNALVSVATKGDLRIVDLLLVCMTDAKESYWVRRAAVQLIPQIVSHGDQHAIHTLIATLNDADLNMDISSALGEIATRGDVQVVEALVANLIKAGEYEWDHRINERNFALLAIGQVAARGDACCIAHAKAMLRTPNLRVNAIRCLAQISEPGCREVIDALAAQLGGGGDGCGSEAAKALELVSGKDNPYAIQTILAYIDCENEHSSFCAIRALIALITLGCSTSINTILPGLRHQHAHVRIATLSVLASVATLGNGVAIAAMTMCLDDQNRSVAKAAAQSLAPLMPGIDRCIIWDLSNRLDHQDAGIRKSARDLLSDMLAMELPIVADMPRPIMNALEHFDIGIGSQPPREDESDRIALPAEHSGICAEVQASMLDSHKHDKLEIGNSQSACVSDSDYVHLLAGSSSIDEEEVAGNIPLIPKQDTCCVFCMAFVRFLYTCALK